jgi:hypothetical protein
MRGLVFLALAVAAACASSLTSGPKFDYACPNCNDIQPRLQQFCEDAVKPGQVRAARTRARAPGGPASECERAQRDDAALRLLPSGVEAAVPKVCAARAGMAAGWRPGGW